jgi:homocysteine S-methyltransferase
MAEELLARPIVFLDGGLGTTLEEEHGIQFSDATPLWSSHLLISSPEILLKVQTDFARAGADILLTATYQASFEGFSRTPREPQHADEGGDSRTGYDRAEAAGYMRSAVGIARTAFKDAGRPTGLIALSLGAFGATMMPSQEYTGEYPEELMDSKGLYDFHLDRITCFTEDEETWDSIGLVGFETLPRLAEIEAVRLVMHNVNSSRGQKEFWISCVFPNDDDLPDGSTITDVVAAMLSK